MVYTERGLLMIREKNNPVERKATTAEVKSYINNHHNDLSGYALLELTLQNWDKKKEENENTPKFRSFGI